MDTTITVRISAEEKQRLEELSRETGLTISQLIRKGIKEVSNNKENQQDSLEISDF